jgi:type III secretion system FlhB-like substrate exporter
MTYLLAAPPQEGPRTHRRRRMAAALRAVTASAMPPGRTLAPRATALDDVAERILSLAEAGGVPLGPDVDLAEALVRLDLGEPIPPEAVVAIAAVLLPLLSVRGAL